MTTLNFRYFKFFNQPWYLTKAGYRRHRKSFPTTANGCALLSRWHPPVKSVEKTLTNFAIKWKTTLTIGSWRWDFDFGGRRIEPWTLNCHIISPWSNQRSFRPNYKMNTLTTAPCHGRYRYNYQNELEEAIVTAFVHTWLSVLIFRSYLGFAFENN